MAHKMEHNMNREEYLQHKVEPYDPSKINSVEEALTALEGCSFQGRNLGVALEVLTNMIQAPNCLRVLTMSGAMIPAGMEEIICQAIERKVIGAITSTGANIIHSIVNASDKENHQAHFMGTDKVNDSELFNYRINRIYDTYLPEEYYCDAAETLDQIIEDRFQPGEQYILTPSEIYNYVGTKLPGRSFLSVAAQNNVPVFCGATSDSEFAMDLMRYRKYKDIKIILDEMGDIETFASLIRKYDTWGTIILGGGVPRNWSQQIFPYLDQTREPDEREYPGYEFSVRFHSAIAEDGGLSGCTISESISWGKYTADAKNQSVWGNSTVYLPILMTALFQRMNRLNIQL